MQYRSLCSLQEKLLLQLMAHILPMLQLSVSMRKRSRVPLSWWNVRDIQLCDYSQAYRSLDRYWGESSPYQTLNAETLQLLTLEQSIADFVHFAKVAPLPFDSKKSNADKAPWVFSGGSYSGALAAWIESTSPGTFWAYHASSAPVQAIDDYVSRRVQSDKFVLILS